MSKIKTIGLIVEDDSDFKSFKKIITRIVGKDNISFKKMIGNGCGKIRRKALPWAENLKKRGCNMLILVHDLDRHNLAELRVVLSKSLEGNPIANSFICIPIEEIEGWYLSDPHSLKKTFNLKRLPKFKGLPETISSPKEKLRDSIYQCSEKKTIYLNTKHNPMIAENVCLKKIESKCNSFKELKTFIEQYEY